MGASQPERPQRPLPGRGAGAALSIGGRGGRVPLRPEPGLKRIAALFFVSGATALVYEVLWLRWLVLIFGASAFAVSTALTSFMAGLALGAWLVGRRIDRIERPLRVYGALEIAIGLAALAVPRALEAVRAAQGAAWAAVEPPPLAFALIRFALCFAVLLVPTALMGGTLPALARWTAGRPRFTARVGALYGVNTVGAFAGTLATGFLLLPSLGHLATNRLAAAMNIAVGLAALALDRRALRRATAAATGLGPSPAAVPAPVAVAPARQRLTPVHAALAATGFAALVLEVAWTRVLILVIGPTVYAFSLMLAAFLAGLGLGSLATSGILARRGGAGRAWMAALAGAAGAFAFVTLHLLHRLPYLYVLLFRRWGGAEGGAAPAFAVAMAVSAAVMLPPTLAMGGLFPAGLAALGERPGGSGRAVGGLYAANTAGAILGAFAAGFALIPAIGLQRTILAAAWLYLATAAALLVRRSRPRPAIAAAVLALAAGLAMAALAPSWDRLVLARGTYQSAARLGPPTSADEFARALRGGAEELFYREGLVSTVLVLRDPGTYRWLGPDSVTNVFLVVNGKVDASTTGDMPTQVLSAHIPLLLHPEPRRVLIVGLASGTTAGSALRHGIEQLDVVEIEPAVVEASRHFESVNGNPLADPRTRLHVADGRLVLALPGELWDVIVSEPSNPWMTGVSNLFTVEYFRLARARLAPGGLYAQWFQLYGMSPANLAVLLRTFATVFPHAYVFNTIPYSDLLLVGSNRPIGLDLDRIETRMARPEVRKDLARVGIDDLPELLARTRWGPAELAALARTEGPINTDDNARIEFAAPRDLYRVTLGGNDRLLESVARGIAPYLDAADLATRPELLSRLAEAYHDLAFYAEARWTKSRIAGGGDPTARPPR